MYSEGFHWLNFIVTIAAAAAAFRFLLTNNNSPYPSSSAEAAAAAEAEAAAAAEKEAAAEAEAEAEAEAAEEEAAAAEEEAAAAAADLLLHGEYEVFLSFRGSDTRDGFTDFLYTYLHGAGVRTFRDDNELRVSEDIGPELLKAIKGSKISIPIFSKNYASSKWCLREIAQIWDCHTNEGQMIFPIFYNVDPDTVKHQKGSYEEAFRQHKEGLDEKIVQGWEKALTEVGRLKGLELKKETSGREGELVKVIVQKVLVVLKKNYTHVPENLVGMEHHEEEMKRLLEVESSGVRIVGIHGLGGLGKTTIAKVIYNQIYERFERCCFLDDIQDKSKQDKDIVNLQNHLLSKIQNREVPSFVDYDEGRDMIKDAVRGKKVLIVLDNVDRNFQIDKLVGNHYWFGDQSRIIVTTRNKGVLDRVEKTCRTEDRHKVYMHYEPKLLNNDDSLQLFCRHAFRCDFPPEGYDKLAMEFVSIAANLPLVLVTLGSSLFVEECKDVWEEKLKKLENVPNGEVIEKLRFSFEALEHDEQHIFLDVACVFSGVNKQEPCYMWDACGFFPRVGISSLVRRSLIAIGDDDTLIMHDSLRDLGKQIIREEGLSELGKRSRLRGKEASQVLKACQGTNYVQVLRLSLDDFEEFKLFKLFEPLRCLGIGYLEENKSLPRLVGQDFAKLPNLRYLSMEWLDLDGDFEGLHSNLRWLEWQGCSGNLTPTNFYLKNLVILDLSNSGITDNWKWWSQIKTAEKLKVLNLSNCRRLTTVPHLSTFASLESLQVDSCWSLRRLDGLEQLVSLRYLDASYCAALERLPDLSKLGKLKTLNVWGCEEITSLQGLDKLESLELLNMNSCDSLERLPNLSNLTKLTSFEASYCSKLIEIQGIDKLGSLEHFDMSVCTSLNKFPDLSNLKKIRKLKIIEWNVSEVQGLGGLESLERLIVTGNDYLERLPDLSNLRWLRKLKIWSCEKLIDIQGLHGLDSLEVLEVYECISIERLTGLSNLKRLKRLTVSICDKLIEIQDLDVLDSLERLNLNYCESLEILPDLSNLRKLESLDISSYESLEILPDLSNLRKLKKLNISYCYMLIKIQGVERLESLEHLDMRHCTSIEKLPELPNYGMLKHIDLRGCTKLYEIQSLRVVESLESLDLSFCKALGNILDLSNLKNLKKLEICCCDELTEIWGLEELESLEVLYIPGCKSIENLPDISNLRNLKDINASFCVKLSKIRGLEELKSLTRLCIAECKSLENLPNLPSTKIERD